MSLLTAIPFAAFLINGGLFWLVLRSRASPKGKLPFCAFLLLNSLTALASFGMHAGLAPSPLFWLKLITYSGTLMNTALLHFSTSYPAPHKYAWPIMGSAYLVFCVFAAMNTSGMFMVGVRLLPGGVASIEFGPWANFMFSFVAMLGAAALALLTTSYRGESQPLEKRRLGYILGAASLTVVAAPLNAIEPLSGYPVDIGLVLASGGVISYAILRYRIMSISLVIRRGAIYSLIAAGLVALASSVVLVVQLVWARTPLEAGLLAGGLAVAVTVLSYIYGARVYGMIEKLYYGPRYVYREQLRHFSQKMGTSLNLEELVNQLLRLAVSSVGASRGVLFLLEAEDENQYVPKAWVGCEPHETGKGLFRRGSPLLAQITSSSELLVADDVDTLRRMYGAWQIEVALLSYLRAQVIVPLKSGRGLIGFIVLGERQEGQISYEQEELELFAPMIYQAGMALQNAIDYSAAQAKLIRDSLTGAYNHPYLHERLEEEIQRADRLGLSLTVVMVDIDMFHLYNRMYGHPAGDEALRETARIIRNCIRVTDLLFRYGGEEFVIVVLGSSAHEVMPMVERLRRKLEEHHFPAGSDAYASLTMSAGVASYPSHASNRENLLFCSDLAMLRAKQQGRNMVCAWSPLEDKVLDDALPQVEDRDVPAALRQVAYLDTIHALAASLDARDPQTQGHSRNVAKYVVLLAQASGLPAEQIAVLRTAALLHDIGKIGIPDGILHGKGKLSQADQEQMERHPIYAENILGQVPELTPLMPAIRHHHERYDGTGYPAKLAGDYIPLEARILAIADAYEAMTSGRRYRHALDRKEALGELQRMAGSQFDPQLVEVFCKAVTEQEAHE